MKICIVGGGTTGWWAAGYLENHFPDDSITLIESPTIDKIGVGESTLPQVKFFFDSLGIRESEWMEKCHAVKKHANVKQGWDSPSGQPFHFTFWLDLENKFDSWVENYQSGNASIDDFNQLNFAEDGLYAYHLDAESASSIVKNRCRNVTHLIDTIDHLPPGHDLYLDCTGFKRRFVLDRSMISSPFHQVDRAVVSSWKLDTERATGITWTIARPFGWQFEIDLTNRIGSGYVFCSRYLSDEQAISELKEFNSQRDPLPDREPRMISWSPGYLKNPWSGNVIAMGLAGGFIDPLEANALFMTQYSITLLARCLKKFGSGAKSQGAYNKSMRLAWRNISKYLLHTYGLSRRRDTDFWKYYDQVDCRRSLWENYEIHSHTWTNIYPKAMWALLATYYREFTFKEQRN